MFLGSNPYVRYSLLGYILVENHKSLCLTSVSVDSLKVKNKSMRNPLVLCLSDVKPNRKKEGKKSEKGKFQLEKTRQFAKIDTMQERESAISVDQSEPYSLKLRGRKK